MSRTKLYTEKIELCLTKDQRQSLKAKAARNKLTVNQFMRNLIENHK